MPDIKNKSNQLSAYGFACGYIERVETGSLSVQLWHEGCYHVRCHCNYDGRIFWLSMNNLTIARKIYREASRQVCINDAKALATIGDKYSQYK